MMDKNLIRARDNIIEAAGRATQGFGLGRTIGQIYALLFFSPRPLSLDDIVSELKVSKGNVSTNIRELEKWNAAKRVWVKGSRRDYYEAEPDCLKIVSRGILPLVRRKIDATASATAESNELLARVGKSGNGSSSELARFYARRLQIIDRTRETLSGLLRMEG